MKALGCSMRPPLTHLWDFGRGAIAQSLPLLLSKIHVHSLVSEALRTAVDPQTDGITDARHTNSGGR
jgi:hypothetical protein